MDRYDRQVRIWGSVAQESLNRSHVCLVARNFRDDLLQEVLKSLTLAGVGELSLALEDPGSASGGYGPEGGFFPDSDELFSCGNAEVRVLSWEDVCGPHENCNYTVLVAVNLGVGKEVEWLVAGTPEPLLITMAMEDFGLVHLALREDHFIVDSRPEYFVPDLRIRNAWPELRQFFDSFDLDQWTSCGRFWEIPYPVILYHVLRDVEDKDFASLSTGDVRRRIEERFPNSLDDLNVIEAKRFAHLALRTGLAEHKNIQDLLEASGNSLHKREWFDPLNHEVSYLLKCLERFICRYNSLPVSGNIPDMESSSELYGRLKMLYDAKSREDIRRFSAVMFGKEGQPPPYSGAQETFVKRLDRIGVVHPDRQDAIKSLISIQSELEKCRDPSLNGGIKPLNKFRSFHTSCVIGGVASQEIIKLITHQYIPIVSPFVYRNEA